MGGSAIPQFLDPHEKLDRKGKDKELTKKGQRILFKGGKIPDPRMIQSPQLDQFLLLLQNPLEAHWPWSSYYLPS